MDFVALRERMVDNQIRPSEVSDHEVIRAFLSVPRELFVAPSDRAFAYGDRELPYDGDATGRVMMAPVQLARLVQLLPRTPQSRIMVVGGGRGYSVAILAQLVGEVVYAEESERLAGLAAEALRASGTENWKPFIGPFVEGCPDFAPYDGILLEGATELPPEPLIAQLVDGGVVVGIERTDRISRAMLWERVGEGSAKWPQFEAWAPVLPGFERKREFVF